MKIAFADFSLWDINVLTVDHSPLGGTQSAACYLARELAALGHEVTFLSGITKPGVFAGVNCLSINSTTLPQFQALDPDVMICILGASFGAKFRTMLPARTRLILWNQHAADQAAVDDLRNPAIRDAFDALVLVSHWQLDQYRQLLGIDPARTVVMNNAVAPAFLPDLPPAEILNLKSRPPVLAYTSTPFRGLNVLLKCFPQIRAAVPDAVLKVFSSMAVYFIPSEKDREDFGELYEQCRNTEGVQYVGSLPQSQLAQEMRRAAVLAYPNIFPETSCICVMEAMASGCRVITSEYGALPETSAGFARLISTAQPTEYIGRFVQATVDALHDFQRADDSYQSLMHRQIEYVRDHYTWPARAQQWVQWLHQLTAAR